MQSLLWLPGSSDGTEIQVRFVSSRKVVTLNYLVNKRTGLKALSTHIQLELGRTNMTQQQWIYFTSDYTYRF
jgi:hypothetical protein